MSDVLSDLKELLFDRDAVDDPYTMISIYEVEATIAAIEWLRTVNGTVNAKMKEQADEIERLKLIIQGKVQDHQIEQIQTNNRIHEIQIAAKDEEIANLQLRLHQSLREPSVFCARCDAELDDEETNE